MAQEARSRGVVRWFSDSKGYGFIKPDDGDAELFVHHSSIKSDGYRTLTEGATVEFTFAVGEDNKPKAIDVTGPNGAPIHPLPSGGRRFSGNGGSGGGEGFGGGWRRDNPSDGPGCYNCGGPHFARECPESSGGFGSGSGGGGGGVGGGGNCYNCGQPGHFARECQGGIVGGMGGGSGGGSGACYNCGGFGHLARVCRQGGGRFGGRFGGGGGGAGCYKCGEHGHFARECRA